MSELTVGKAESTPGMAMAFVLQLRLLLPGMPW